MIADKGNNIVLDKRDYLNVKTQINNGPYIKLKNGTKIDTEVTNNFNACNNVITPVLKRKSHISNPSVVILFCSPKNHKTLRRIISSVGSLTFYLMKEFVLYKNYKIVPV